MDPQNIKLQVCLNRLYLKLGPQANYEEKAALKWEN